MPPPAQPSRYGAASAEGEPVSQTTSANTGIRTHVWAKRLSHADKTQPNPVAGFADLRGASRLAIDAVAGITDLVEDMHRNIAGLAPPVGRAPSGGAGGISGLVYRSVRGVTRAVGFGLDLALARLTPLLGTTRSSPRREAVLAALNGVLGDYLAATNNPLAIHMQVRRGGTALELSRAALTQAIPQASAKILVLVHGLCMNDLQWKRDGHDHGAALAAELGYTTLYLHYNSGLHISTNGRAFAALLQQVHTAWPVPVEQLVIVGHSMGGLLARSACHYAKLARAAWLRKLGALVFLGTPHHGAPLERAGNRVHLLAGISPYTAPFTRLARLRSTGVKDLRHGNLLDTDWVGVGATHLPDIRNPVPLPARVACYALAASKRAQPATAPRQHLGDGLVGVRSALGLHDDPARTLAIPATQRKICYALNHFDLLSSAEVYATLHDWLSKQPRA